MGPSERTQAATQAVSTSSALSRQGYALGVPALKRQVGLIGTALDQGEPSYLKDAFATSRALLSDSAASQGGAEVSASRAAGRGAAMGGNLAAQQSFGGSDYGAQLAQAMYSSRVNEAGANVEQMDKMLGFLSGQGQEAGSASLQAMGNQLGAIPYLRNYNPTYSNILAGLNAGSSIYGAGQQAGWFSPQAQIPTTGNTFAQMATQRNPVTG